MSRPQARQWDHSLVIFRMTFSSSMLSLMAKAATTPATTAAATQKYHFFQICGPAPFLASSPFLSARFARSLISRTRVNGLSHW